MKLDRRWQVKNRNKDEPAKWTVIETELTWPVRHPFDNFETMLEFTKGLKKPFSVINEKGTRVMEGNIPASTLGDVS